MNPNSEEGGYACKEHKHKVKPPKKIEGLPETGMLDAGYWILDSEGPLALLQWEKSPSMKQIRQLPWHFSIIISL